MPTYGSFIDEKLECIALIEHPHFVIGNKSFDLSTDKYFLMLAVGKLNTGKYRIVLLSYWKGKMVTSKLLSHNDFCRFTYKRIDKSALP